jgi:hypothetical protein
MLDCRNAGHFDDDPSGRGALMLATSLLLTLRAYRFSTTSKASIGQKVLTEQFSG